MPLEIRELVIKMVVEESAPKSNVVANNVKHLEEQVQIIDEKLARLSETIQNIYDR